MFFSCFFGLSSAAMPDAAMLNSAAAPGIATLPAGRMCTEKAHTLMVNCTPLVPPLP